MVKKLRCTVTSEDYVKVDDQGYGDVRLHVKVDGNKHDIFLTPSDAKKLRKQIKAALIEIEGEYGQDDQEKEDPEYTPHVGEVVEVFQNTVDHHFKIGQKVRVVKVAGELVQGESLNTGKFWWVGGDIRPIQNWKPKEGEKVLIVDSTYVPSNLTRSWIGNFGFIGQIANDAVCKVYNEDKSDWFGFHTSDLRPAE